MPTHRLWRNAFPIIVVLMLPLVVLLVMHLSLAPVPTQAAQIANGDDIYLRALASAGLNTAKTGPIRVRGGMDWGATGAAQRLGGGTPGPGSGPTGSSLGRTERQTLTYLLCGGAFCLSVLILVVAVILLARSRRRRGAVPPPGGGVVSPAPHIPTGGIASPAARAPSGEATGTATRVAATEDTRVGPAIFIPPARLVPRLVVAQGNAKPPSLNLTSDSLTIGRHPACEMVIEDQYVSRQHARLDRQGSVWMIVDLNSTSGTYVNRMRVTRRPLRPGDQIRIGRTVLVFQQGLP